MKQDAYNFALESQTELVQLIDALCRIPAPSHHEDARSAFCKKFWEDAGAKNVILDTAKNVILPISYNESGNNILFIAHMDTVFPDTEPFSPRTEGDRMYCPGIGDDTAHLAILLLAGKFILQNQLLPRNCGVILAANSCEEGLGNLKGIRQLMVDYCVSAVVSFDMALPNIADRCVGSVRYHITATTKGGHSFSNFGNKNAIEALANLVTALYSYNPNVYDGSIATYNVGTISGGTSVNTIAQNAEMLFEYRSDNARCLEEATTFFTDTLASQQSDKVSFSYEIVGVRPCMSPLIDTVSLQKLSKHCVEVIRQYCGINPILKCASTDCNIPLSMSIPAVSVGLMRTEGAHTREEWIDVPSLKNGTLSAMELILSYFA